jgi:ribosomal protein S18 acetylase RimI-like enzyme
MAFTIRTLVDTDTNALNHLLQTYSQQYPPRTCMPAQFYLSPYFDGGQKVACAFDDDSRLVGYAPYFAQGEHAWVEVMALPGLEETAKAKEALWMWVVAQAKQGNQQSLLFQYYPNEDAAIRFTEQQGGQRRYSIFAMRRDLSLVIPALSMPKGFSLRRWRMDGELEQQQYLEGRNASFPEAPTSLEEWQYFAGSTYWEQGINMAAFAGEHLAASVLVYWQPGSPTGSTEYVFTLPEYRGHGLARALLTEALGYLKAHGLRHAGLEVKAENRAALGVYTGLGYYVEAETKVYEVEIEQDQSTGNSRTPELI